MKLKQAAGQTVSENPFYGMKNLLTMQKFFEKAIDDTTNVHQVNTTLTNAWQECKGKDPIYRELFFMIVFSVGDISNREHNMFAGQKIDQGGQSKRKTFMYCLQWLLTEKNEQFYNFLPLIAEYTNYENLFYNQLRTDRNKGTLLSENFLRVDYSKIAKFLAEKIRDAKTSAFELATIAKFLPKVPSSKRYRKDKEGKIVQRDKKEHTKRKDKRTLEFIAAICAELGFEAVKHKSNTSYPDYQKFRSVHMKESEAHLFSTREIIQKDKVEFLTWLEGLPAGARYRVQCRLIDKNEQGKLVPNGKWLNMQREDMGGIYLAWIANKEEAMKKLTALTEEEKKNMTKTELKELTKTAKVTTGGTTIFDSFVDIYSNGPSLTINSELNVKLQTLINKVKMDVPVLTLIDVSGSMSGRINLGNGKSVDRLEFAKLVASIMMYKNPNEGLATMMMTFESKATVYYDESTVNTTAAINRFVQGASITKKVTKLADRSKPFIETFQTIRSLFQLSGGTDLSCVARDLKRWVDSEPSLANSRKEAIQEFPVWVVISDGDLNSSYNAASSMLKFKSELLQYFGASPVVVLWDIVDQYGNNPPASHFEGVENFIHISGLNPAVLNQVFMNISDLDVIDVFITLQTLHKSNRYQPVKTFTL